MVSPVNIILKPHKTSEIIDMHFADNGIDPDCYPPKTPKGAKMRGADSCFLFLAAFGVFGRQHLKSLRLGNNRASRPYWIACGLVIVQSLFGFSIRAEVQGDIPVGLPPARYEQMVLKSPFALATPAAPPVAATPGYAASLYVTGVAKIGEQDFVSIASRDQQQPRFSLLSGEVGKDDISLVSVDWSEQIGKSKVTIKKGTELAVLEFDQAAVQTMTVMPPPGQPPMPMPMQPQLQAPPLGGPGRRVVLPNGNVPGPMPGGPGLRQRTRIINNRPQP